MRPLPFWERAKYARSGPLARFVLAQDLRHRRAEFARARCDGKAIRAHDLGLFRRAVADGGDDGAGMTHAAALRGGETGDETDDRLRHVLLDPGGGFRLLRTADLADHQH